jgi:ABC-2 type transport system ATP-binding protein
LPDSGKVKVFGKDALKQRHDVQQVINVVSGFSGVLKGLTVEDTLHYYALAYSVPNPREKVDEVMELVELTGKRRHEACELSSGLRQRLFLAKALLNNPRMVFLDEPTVGLDVGMALRLRALINELKKKGLTVVLTTHYMKEAEELCDRIALINEGKIVALGSARELKNRVRKKKIIEVQTTHAMDLRKKVTGLPGVVECWYAGDILRVEVEDYKLIRRIARKLIDEGVKLDSVSIVEPSLEKVFLKLTSRKLTKGFD